MIPSQNLTFLCLLQVVPTTVPFRAIGAPVPAQLPANLSRPWSSWRWSRRIPTEDVVWPRRAAEISTGSPHRSPPRISHPRSKMPSHLLNVIYFTISWNKLSEKNTSFRWHAIRALYFFGLCRDYVGKVSSNGFHFFHLDLYLSRWVNIIM